jgi:hypothetical protein
MKFQITSLLLQLSITVSLFSLAFYAFTQTSLFDQFTTALQSFGSRMPVLKDFEGFVPSIFTLLLYVITLFVGIFGGKGNLNLVYYFSLLLYFPSAFAFSAVNWIDISGTPFHLESFLSFNQVLLVGLALIICRLFLISLNRINDKKSEFVQRGETKVDGVGQNLIFYSSVVLGLSVVMAVIAMIVLVIGESAMTTFLVTLPYPQLLFGLGSIFTLLVFLYYYLKRRLSMESQQ